MFLSSELPKDAFHFNTKVPCFFNSLSPDILSSVSVSTFKKKTEETPSYWTCYFLSHPSLLALCFFFISFFNTLLLRIIVNKNVATKKLVLLIASFSTEFSQAQEAHRLEKNAK